MVQVLERPARRKSVGERLLEGLGNAGHALPELLGEYQKTRDKRSADLQKKLSRITKDTASYLNSTRKGEYLPTDIEPISDLASKYINEGYGTEEAIRQAYQDYRSSQPQGKEASGALGDLFGGETEGPFDVAPGTRGKFSESPHSRTFGQTFAPSIEAVKKNPKLLLEEAPTGIARGIEDTFSGRNLSDFLTQITGYKPSKPKPFGDVRDNLPFVQKQQLLSDLLSSKIRPQEMSPDEQAAREQIAGTYGNITQLGFPSLLKKLLPKSTKAISPSAVLGPEAQKALPFAGKAGSTVEAEATAPSLKGRVTPPPETATEMRVARTRPEKKMYPVQERQRVLQEQLKAFPKYAEEIAQDAAERAMRAESRIPKTVKGRQSQEIRIHEAEKKYPQVQEGYNKALARVRAIEDQMARRPESVRKELQPLYEAAQQEMLDAQFDLKQSFENLKGVNVRAGIDEMRTAARNKLTGIQDAIADGEEVKLAKMDYNPEMVKKGKALQKKVHPPQVKEDDFYRQVHEIYGDEYRNRLKQVNEELRKPVSSLSHAEQKRALVSEKEILNKLLDQIEAERAIQHRRLALRETAERKKLSDRLGKLEKKGPEPKVTKTVQEKIWRDRIVASESPEAQAGVIDEAVEQVAKESPKASEQIRKEGERLKDFGKERFREPKTPETEPLPKSGETAKSQAKSALKAIREFQNKIDNLLKKIPILGKTFIGRNIAAGLIISLLDQINKDLKLGIPTGVISTIFFKRIIGIPVQQVGKMIGNKLIKAYRTKQAKDAYEKGNAKKFYSYPPAIRKEAVENFKSS
jgi:hypothetical protein